MQSYVDPSNCLVVIIENALSLPEPYVMVMFQGNQYVNAKGINYLITPSYEDMNPQGFVFHKRANTEPLRTATMGSNPLHNRGAWSEAFPKPPGFTVDWEPKVSS